MEPCFPCPRGYFQERNGSDHCFKCPFKTTTLYPASDSFGNCLGLHNYPFKVNYLHLQNSPCFMDLKQLCIYSHSDVDLTILMFRTV